MNTARTALDLAAPKRGTARDCYEVAWTACLLASQRPQHRHNEPARHAAVLHRISGQLHRLDERACNGEAEGFGPRRFHLERQAQEIATYYGLTAYHQGDPRGCSLYLIAANEVPQHGDELHRLAYGKPTPLATLQARWVEANYSRGHAVVRIGR